VYVTVPAAERSVSQSKTELHMPLSQYLNSEMASQLPTLQYTPFINLIIHIFRSSGSTDKMCCTSAAGWITSCTAAVQLVGLHLVLHQCSWLDYILYCSSAAGWITSCTAAVQLVGLHLVLQQCSWLDYILYLHLYLHSLFRYPVSGTPYFRHSLLKLSYLQLSYSRHRHVTINEVLNKFMTLSSSVLHWIGTETVN
jgi:hypothetical protein